MLTFFLWFIAINTITHREPDSSSWKWPQQSALDTLLVDMNNNNHKSGRYTKKIIIITSKSCDNNNKHLISYWSSCNVFAWPFISIIDIIYCLLVYILFSNIIIMIIIFISSYCYQLSFLNSAGSLVSGHCYLNHFKIKFHFHLQIIYR